MTRLALTALLLISAACGGDPDPVAEPVAPVIVFSDYPATIGIFEVVEVSARESYDPDDLDAELLFRWDLVESPNGSNAKPIQVKPDLIRMLGDRVGLFVIGLTVTDADGLQAYAEIAFQVEI